MSLGAQKQKSSHSRGYPFSGEWEPKKNVGSSFITFMAAFGDKNSVVDGFKYSYHVL
jgi:hypothetical protein